MLNIKRKAFGSCREQKLNNNVEGRAPLFSSSLGLCLRSAELSVISSQPCTVARISALFVIGGPDCAFGFTSGMAGILVHIGAKEFDVCS